MPDALDDEASRREVLAALDLPPAGVDALLAHVERYARARGTGRRHAALLALVRTARGRPGR